MFTKHFDHKKTRKCLFLGRHDSFLYTTAASYFIPHYHLLIIATLYITLTFVRKYINTIENKAHFIKCLNISCSTAHTYLDTIVNTRIISNILKMLAPSMSFGNNFLITCLLYNIDTVRAPSLAPIGVPGRVILSLHPINILGARCVLCKVYGIQFLVVQLVAATTLCMLKNSALLTIMLAENIARHTCGAIYRFGSTEGFNHLCNFLDTLTISGLFTDENNREIYCDI